ncbi:MAG: type III polyketide synthase [Planctomycetota bacterium]
MSDAAPVHLAGLGVARPATSMSQMELADAAITCCCDNAQQAKVLRELYRRSGVERRGCAILDGHVDGKSRQIEEVFPPRRTHSDRGPTLEARMQLYVEAAGPLAIRAAAEALRDASIHASTVGHLITVSCTGFAAPGVDSLLIQQLGLSPNVSRTHVGFMGCHAAINGWQIADALAARTGRPSLLVCVEVCTAHFAYGWEPNRLVANALFADGAAAAVLQPESQTTPENRPGPHMIDRLSRIVPQSGDAMTWQLGDHGFEMTLSPRVPEHIERHAGDALLSFLRSHDLTPHQLVGVIVHPGGPRVVRATTAALGLPASAAQSSLDALREHGNLSSPTVLTILSKMLRESPQHQSETKHWLVVAFGPGLAIEAMLLRG